MSIADRAREKDARRRHARWWWGVIGTICPSVVAALLVFALCVGIDQAYVLKLFSDTLQVSFFTSFIALGGFLLALKTFIVVKMKELVYDSPAYARELRDMRGSEPDKEHYRPLRNLSELLFFSILACFIAALLQFTLGLWKCIWATSICIAIAVLALGLLLTSLVVTRNNLVKMFEYLEKTPGEDLVEPDQPADSDESSP